ncbi:MAG: DNA translocase FtsK 4TM domain-containing protein, partial [Paracoccaceae bacterium]
MASYQARQRDPLLDQSVQAALERRGKELLGLCLLGAGVLTALLLISYSPDDPSWLAATDAPAKNLLGRFGASLASPLFVIAGYGAWGAALIPAAWGLRFLSHRGTERALNRAIFAPIAVAAVSVYASTLVAGRGWDHSFGLGGLFGDTVLGALLGILPIAGPVGFKLLSLLMAVAALALTTFAAGIDRRELAAGLRFLLTGTVMTYAWIAHAAGRGAFATVRGAQTLAEGARDRRALA